MNETRVEPIFHQFNMAFFFFLNEFISLEEIFRVWLTLKYSKYDLSHLFSLS